LAVEVNEQLLREVLAGFGERRPRRHGKAHDHAEQGREEAPELQLGAAFAQVEHQCHQTVEGQLALTGESLRVQGEPRDHLGACQSLPYICINRFK
jgi:hypothetical protein